MYNFGWSLLFNECVALKTSEPLNILQVFYHYLEITSFKKLVDNRLFLKGLKSGYK